MHHIKIIITYALGEHDPGSAQDWRASNDFCRPGYNMNMGRWTWVAGHCFEVSAELPRQKVKVKSAMCCKMQHFVPTYSGSMANEWRTSAFSKYTTKFIYFHTGHKRKEN